jgi:hypothetical protein
MIMKMNGVRKTVVQETEYGMYVWILPNGKLFIDDDYNVLNIPAREGDREKIQMLRDAARHYGQPEGQPFFMAGNRRITDEELEEQIQRMQWGLVPDPYDVGALKDELRWRKAHGR